MKFGPVIENNDTKKVRESLFQNFHFLAFFDPPRGKNHNFWSSGGQKRPKNENFEKVIP